MNYLTDEQGQAINPQNPLSVYSLNMGGNQREISAEAVTFVTGAAGLTGLLKLELLPILTPAGDAVGSFWRSEHNIVGGTNFKLYTKGAGVENQRPQVNALTETNGSADIAIENRVENMEELFETATGTRRYVVSVIDKAGNELWGYIDAVATSGDVYTLDVYDAPASGNQNWNGSISDFDNTDIASFTIYRNASSFQFVTGTIATEEVGFDGSRTYEDQIRDLSNGQYFVDYRGGVIGYRKATTGTGDTVNYRAFSGAAGGSASGEPAGDELTVIGGLAVDPTSLPAPVDVNDAVQTSHSLEGEVLAYLSRYISGEDSGRDVMKVQSQNQFAYIAANGTNLLKTGAGNLHAITITTAGASSNTITVYDSTTGSGTIIAVIDAAGNRAEQTYFFDVEFTNGLTIVTATGTAAKFTVSYS